MLSKIDKKAYICFIISKTDYFMKLRFLQLTVFIAGCLGLFFICYPDCLAVFSERECEKLHFRTSEYMESNSHPVKVDSTHFIMRDTSISVI